MLASIRGIYVSPPGLLESYKCTEGFMLQGWDRILPRWGGASSFPRGITPHRVLAPRASANQRPAGAVGVSSPCGGVSTRGIIVSVSGVSKLQIVGSFSNPGVGPYSRVQRRLNIVPRGKFHRVLALRAPANFQSADGDGVPTPCGEV